MLFIFITLYFTSLVLTYLYNWEFVPFDYLHPVPPSPTPCTYLISFSMSLFVFEVQLVYNSMLVPVTQHNDLIFQYISK